jgi:hypothetical protein
MIEEIMNLPSKIDITVGKDVWKLKFLRPKEKLQRTIVIAQLLNLVPIESVSIEDHNRAFIFATLQLAYIDGPAWFKDKLSEKFIDFPDEEYLLDIWSKYLQEESKFEEAKKKLRHPQ